MLLVTIRIASDKEDEIYQKIYNVWADDPDHITLEVSKE